MLEPGIKMPEAFAIAVHPRRVLRETAFSEREQEKTLSNY